MHEIAPQLCRYQRAFKRDEVDTRIDACRTHIEKDVRAFVTHPDDEVRSLEPRYFNNFVLTLNHMVVHQLRSIEGRDANALNEVRVICLICFLM